MSRVLTVIIHGTYAAEATWWRLGAGGQETFADRLESELSRRGCPGSVWRPALDVGLGYSAFAWSGLNRHRDRRRAAVRLNASLAMFAHDAGATKAAPVTVNFVAHSHGGNVVLDLLRILDPAVRVGRVVLLGTPLITVRPAFRLVRFGLAAMLVALAFLFLLVAAGVLVYALVQREFPDDGARSVALFALPMVLGYGWLFWVAGNLSDVAWRVVCRAVYPLVWLTGRSPRRVYGPRPSRLSRRLGGAPILLLTTQNDEADLALRIGSTPARLYAEYVAAEVGVVGRVLERVLVRPFVIGVVVVVAEVALEVLALGFPLWRALFIDHEVAPLDEQPYYPASLLRHAAVPYAPEYFPAPISGAAILSPPGSTPAPARRGLHLSLMEVTEEIKRQIRLRHASYYENAAVIRTVAEFLTGEKVATSEPRAAVADWRGFWETLFLANVGLTLGARLIADPGSLGFVLLYAVGVMGYVFPLTVGGVLWVSSRTLGRPAPDRWPRGFWVAWTVCALLFLWMAWGGVLATGHR